MKPRRPQKFEGAETTPPPKSFEAHETRRRPTFGRRTKPSQTQKVLTAKPRASKVRRRTKPRRPQKVRRRNETTAALKKFEAHETRRLKVQGATNHRPLKVERRKPRAPAKFKAQQTRRLKSFEGVHETTQPSNSSKAPETSRPLKFGSGDETSRPQSSKGTENPRRPQKFDGPKHQAPSKVRRRTETTRPQVEARTNHAPSKLKAKPRRPKFDKGARNKTPSKFEGA